MRLAALPRRTRQVVLLCTLCLGLLLFVWQLGASGLVDETPPLFAASARGMLERGDWLIPHVNGLPRYDKPPLVYWLMGLLYALLGQARWDPLGSWAPSLPSALATVVLMLAMADTLLRWPQPALSGHNSAAAAREPGSPGEERPSPWAAGAGPFSTATSASVRSAALTALAAPLAFALSPLVLLWGRIPVSDGLFTALLSLALLAAWRCHAARGRGWPWPWLLLGLAVLTKGPVAVVLLLLTLLLFAVLQGELMPLRLRLRPLPGLLLTALVALPWYGLALCRDGRAFWDSFIGYHNLQRFTVVVNDHLQPWWYFGPVLLVAALPVTPLLLLGLGRALQGWRLRRPLPPEQSLARFAACWLLAILLFFTLAATKLPSYWLPATPAAALLVALTAQLPWRRQPSPIASAATLPDDPAEPDGSRSAERPAQAAQQGKADRLSAAGSYPPADSPSAVDAAAKAIASSADRPDRALQWAWALTLLLAALLALVFALGPLWVPSIFDPEMPTLPAELLASGALRWSASLWALAAVLGWWLRTRPGALRLLALQLPLVLFVPLALMPTWRLGDRLRGLPVRQMAAAVQRLENPGEPLAMVGILKPSLHYYSRRVVIYEGIEPEGLVNLADRLRREHRPGMHSGPLAQVPTVLVVIDRTTAAAPFWQGLDPQPLASAGLYRLWRLDRRLLDQRAASLQAAGHPITWSRPRPERY